MRTPQICHAKSKRLHKGVDSLPPLVYSCIRGFITFHRAVVRMLCVARVHHGRGLIHTYDGRAPEAARSGAGCALRSRRSRRKSPLSLYRTVPSRYLWCLWWRLLPSPPQQPRTILEVTSNLGSPVIDARTASKEERPLHLPPSLGRHPKRGAPAGSALSGSHIHTLLNRVWTSPGQGARGPAPGKARRVPALKRA